MIRKLQMPYQDLVAIILDHECDPKNPFVIKLHCVKLKIYWKRLESGKWDGDKWINGKYEYYVKVR